MIKQQHNPQLQRKHRYKIKKKVIYTIIFLFISIFILSCIGLISIYSRVIQNLSNVESNAQIESNSQIKSNAQRELNHLRTVPINQKPRPVLDRSLHNIRSNAEIIWNDLLIESKDSEQIIIEVGVHDGKQCIHAAIQGYQVYCLEPSPKSFAIIKKNVKLSIKDENIQSNVHLLNVAAGNETSEIQFLSSGGTGDHVVLNKGKTPNIYVKVDENTKEEKIVSIPQRTLDDIINKVINSLEKKVYLIKVDTQGYEANVMQGMKKSIQSHAINYVLLEYWPKGIDALSSSSSSKKCSAPVQMLQFLVQQNYTLFALSMNWHAKERQLMPKSATIPIKRASGRPYDDLYKNCMWYYQLEHKYSSKDYLMGYWSDILAVSPEAQLHDMQTKTGEVLLNSSLGIFSHKMSW